MAEVWISHTWQRRPGVRPALIAATEVRGQIAPALSRPCLPWWVLDYEFAPYGLCRIRSARSPWEPRLARTAHLYPPGLPFWEDTRGHSGPRHSAWVLFTHGDAAGLPRLLHPRLQFGRFLDDTGELGALLREMARLGHEQGEAGFWEAQGLLNRLFALLLRAQPAGAGTWRLAAPAVLPGPARLAQTVRRFLADHLAERLTLGRLAAHLHVSVSTLSHVYARETGESPLATLRRLRIERARLLVMQGLPLKVIAEQLGFSDAFHLSKTFKRLEGASPRELRHGAVASVSSAHQPRPGRTAT